MRHDLSSLVVAFPKQLMSTARSPLSMPVTMARMIRNMLVSADGAGTKRNGVVAVGDAFDGDVVAVMAIRPQVDCS